ncbi:UDP glucuronosyltransferase 5 family, polypeptide D1 [Triplophysa rosa]|uniref:UDP-glucuronosyltransferase n=1 Tax=Triplophysa rosa TaxID=992332 RepID=A0A9W7T9W9_TRIRA|nr:UDP glucuronosyltransferase 5 family, polypeptide D1 [Triplophysa rosa]KAI7793325.1 UDP glucuronosyltransferase 5 family [Triplophysa rosa]
MKSFSNQRRLTMIGLFLALSVFALSCSGGKVLVYPVDGSHWVNMKVLIEEMHTRGHSITVIRPNSSWYIADNSPFYSSITIPDEMNEFEDFWDEYLWKTLEKERGHSSALSFLELQADLFSMLSKAHHLGCNMLSFILEDKKLVKKLKDERYDLVLTDPAIAGGVVLAHYLKLPLVLNVRWTASGEGHLLIAPSPLSYVPLPGTGNTNKMSFSQRVRNILFHSFTFIMNRYVVDPHYDVLIEKYLDEKKDIVSLMQAADLWLMRVDFVFEFPRPTMPNVVYMGGFQCKPSKPLPQDLEAFAQSSGDHGFIIMSLGTLVKSLPMDMTNEIAATFASLPQKVIWRHLGPRPSTVGNNTLIVEWMPQNDLLGHSKIKAFVAHGGTNGVQEAIYHGVPILGMPLFFDQFDNLIRVQEKGAGIILRLSEINGFGQALRELVSNASYRTDMQRISRLHRDQPMRPLDTAIFWIEHVMRHKGAKHLRSEFYNMSWYSYHSVDVFLVLLGVFAVFVFTTVAIIRYVCCRICCKRKLKKE